MSKSTLNLISFLIGLLVCGIFVNKYTQAGINFENFAMGRNTTSYFPVKDDMPIHFDRLSEEAIDHLNHVRYAKKPTILILGNSQTHGINQMGENDINYPEILFDSLDINVLTFSIPNANLQEMYLAYEYIKQKVDIKLLIIPTFFDDMREDGIRDIFFNGIVDQEFSINGSSQIDLKINDELSAFVKKKEPETETNRRISLQDRSEEFLDGFMDSKSVAWKNRDKLRGTVFTKLYVTRNTVLGINAQTKRRMIPVRYNNNILALNELLNHTNNENVKTLVYVPPIRNDVEIPYSLKEYDSFKMEIESKLSSLENAKFENFENLVPGKFWGLKNGTNLSGKKELDFMHFTGEGHRLLATQLINQIHGLNDF